VVRHTFSNIVGTIYNEEFIFDPSPMNFFLAKRNHITTNNSIL